MDDPAYLTLVCSTAGDGDDGVYGFRLDPADGRTTTPERSAVPKPAYAAVHPDGTHVYAVNRVEGGRVSALRVDRDEATVTRLGHRPSEGAGPCHVSVDATGRYAFVAAYDAGRVAAFPIADDGRLEAASDVVEHEGSGVDPDRQSSPHPHSAVPGPRNRFVYVPDLGTDRIAVYRLDADAGRLRPADPPHTTLADGSGPRHLAFGPDGGVGYVVNELDSTLTSLSYDPETGALAPVETASTLPDGADADENACADVHVHPSGRWVYASNRGHDSIAVFEASDRGGLRPAGHASTRGRTPRDFALDPSGRWLLAENRASGTVVPFAVDGETGALEPAGAPLSVPKPTCAVFVERR